ncbi:4Fe-4S dicluster domain-containing protein [Candidatus Woesearchaeota archaeon]|nr:4Fe-4S dicluster domain-containing protein [Candidatus Woesearchaeota archaeon]
MAEDNKEPKKPYPVVDDKKCTGCNTCIEICPMEVFVLEGTKAVVKRPDQCIGCRACESQCPENAIRIIDE